MPTTFGNRAWTFGTPPAIDYWLKGEPKLNFGDALVELIMRDLVSGVPATKSVFYLMGSVICETIIAPALARQDLGDDGCVVFWCCGCRSDERLPLGLMHRVVLSGARGPLTRAVLDLPGDTPLGDPGFLLPILYRPRSRPGPSASICIPHFFEPMRESDVLQNTGADRVVSPIVSPGFASIETVLDEIAHASFVLTGSLHAAIAAAAYGTPFAFWAGSYIDVPFKWRDLSALLRIDDTFVTTVREGVELYRDRIEGRIVLPRLKGIVDACPLPVNSDKAMAALAWDEAPSGARRSARQAP